MEQIEHKYVEVNGLKIHVAEIGNEHSPPVVFLHGFPEIWYTWRYQMIAVAKAGYTAIAPDFGGCGLSDHSPQPEKTTFLDLVNDLLALIDALNISKEPGRAEADFGRFDAKTVVRKVYIMFSGSEIPIANEDQEIMDIVQPGTPLPTWFIEEDLAACMKTLDSKLLCRSLAEQLNIPDLTVDVPALFIMGLKDYVLKFPGMEDYIRDGGLKSLAPNMEIAPLHEDNHFVHEQLPDEVNQRVLNFLTKNCKE